MTIAPLHVISVDILASKILGCRAALRVATAVIAFAALAPLHVSAAAAHAQLVHAEPRADGALLTRHITN